MDEVKTLLDEEYKKTLQDVSETMTDSEESRWALTKLNELHEQRIKEMQIQSDFKVKEKELRIKEAQLKESKKDRVVRSIHDAAALLIPIGFSSYWMAKGLKFEESGSFTSRTGQWISNNLRLFKK